MHAFAFVADTGRPSPPGPALHLLNAGWTTTIAQPTPDNGFTLPGQALVVFLEAELHEQNRLFPLTAELVDDEGDPVELVGPSGLRPARFEHKVIVPPVPGAPPSAPGRATVLVDLPAGSLRIPNARGWYTWTISIAEVIARAGFWVEAPPSPPVVGGTSAGA